ncbi:MAG: HU family DNA-binding protein, partial [Paludibacter sp.]|nr:HU family DNA-binding protein [Paludibacter sp.]
MNKDKVSTQELVKQLAKRLNINEKLAEDFLKAMFSTMEEELLRGEPVKVKNLGVFKLQWNEPRKSVDVTTGDEIMLEGYNKISFTPDSKLKDIVNEPFAYLEPVLLDGYSPVLEPVKTDEGFDTLNILSGQAAEIKSLLSEISALSANNTMPTDEGEPKGDDELNVEFIETQYDIVEEPVEEETTSTEDKLIEEEEGDELLNSDTEIIVPIDEDTIDEVESTGNIVVLDESSENEVINKGEIEEIKLEEVPESEG